MIRLQKFLADSGLASRRESERFISDGRVAVNGEVVRVLGTKVNPAADTITVEGKEVRPRRKIYVVLHKPAGFVCTRRDPRDRKVVADLLPAEWAHLFTVGRLDRESEGLLFLTNDGDFSLRLTHPRYGVRKKYRVLAAGRVEPRDTEIFLRGVKHEGEFLRADSVRIINANNSHSTVELELSQGKNREVRRLFDIIGRPVERLQRVQVGPIKLGQLPAGRWRVLTESEIKSLLQPVPRVQTLAHHRSGRPSHEP
ncbi:MAG TPA: pseudouridine synthase [Verrucomicrobiota bacterium]|nr:pseudouridine synthase [Verrucomicrobiota bacterium]